MVRVLEMAKNFDNLRQLTQYQEVSTCLHIAWKKKLEMPGFQCIKDMSDHPRTSF